MKGGSIKKFVLNGFTWPLSSDNDPNFTPGGRMVTEKQETTEKPYFLVDSVSGVMSGLEARLSHSDGTVATMNSTLATCADDGPVSCSVEMADGAKYTASGGVMVIADNAADGMMTLREGKFSFSVHPEDGVWVLA